jgi:hypothetical protein
MIRIFQRLAKPISMISLVFLISACEVEVQNVNFGTKIKDRIDIKQKCALLIEGMNIVEAKAIMDKAASSKEYNQYNYGEYTFWNRPKSITNEELVALMFPQGETCIAHFNTDQTIAKVEYKFITQEQYHKSYEKRN